MVIETVEERVVRIERACERAAERLGLIEHRLKALEPRLTSSVTSLQYELLAAVDALRSEVRAGTDGLRHQGRSHFSWMLTLLGAIVAAIIAAAVAR